MEFELLPSMECHDIRIFKNAEESNKNSLERDSVVKVGSDEVTEVQERNIREVVVKRESRDHRDEAENTERKT